jgi:hypothetical protein
VGTFIVFFFLCACPPCGCTTAFSSFHNFLKILFDCCDQTSQQLITRYLIRCNFDKHKSPPLEPLISYLRNVDSIMEWRYCKERRRHHSENIFLFTLWYVFYVMQSDALTSNGSCGKLMSEPSMHRCGSIWNHYKASTETPPCSSLKLHQLANATSALITT